MHSFFLFFVSTGSKIFKQVAKKSTSLLPQKLAMRDVQNGHIRTLHTTVHSRTLQLSNNNSCSDASNDDEESVNSNQSFAVNQNVGLTGSKGRSDETVSADDQMLNLISSESCLSLESDDAAAEKRNDVDVKQSTMKSASRLSDGEDKDAIVIVNDNHAADAQNCSSSRQLDRTKRSTDDSAESTTNKKARLEEPKDSSGSNRKTIVVGRKVVHRNQSV